MVGTSFYLQTEGAVLDVLRDDPLVAREVERSVHSLIVWRTPRLGFAVVDAVQRLRQQVLRHADLLVSEISSVIVVSSSDEIVKDYEAAVLSVIIGQIHWAVFEVRDPAFGSYDVLVLALFGDYVDHVCFCAKLVLVLGVILHQY